MAAGAPAPTRRSLGVRCLAEAAGTATLVGIGTGSIVAGANAGGVPQVYLALAWFAAVAVPVLLLARTSGAHLNPAVTLALVVAGRSDPRELAPYSAAQTAGAFGGSAAVALTLGRSAHLGATVPWHGETFLVIPLEAAFTAALVLSVLYLASRPSFPSWGLLLLPALVVGFSTYLIGPWTGSSLNPARTVAPALLSGEYSGLWAYLAVVPVAAGVTAWAVARRLTPTEPRAARTA